MAKTGKIDLSFFKQNIGKYCGFANEKIITGPQFGVDVSVVKINEKQAMVAASDPMSFIPSLGAKDSAWLSVVLASNDIATSGHAPQYAQIVLNLSNEMEEDIFKEYWKFIHEFCDQLGISIIGGHTGFVPHQNSTFSGGITLFSFADSSKILTSNHAQEGDVIVMTKQAGLLSTAILAKSFPETVKKELGENVLEDCQQLFYQSSVLEEALLAANAKGVSAMHDVTEGGVLGAVKEMALASEMGFEIDKNKIKMNQNVEKMGQLFGYDPQQSVGAGSLIVAVNPNHLDLLMGTLRSRKIECTAIGKFQSKKTGYKIQDNTKIKDFRPLENDPYWSAFYHASEKGWK